MQQDAASRLPRAAVSRRARGVAQCMAAVVAVLGFGGHAAPANAAEIRIGLAAPLSGRMAPQGDAMRRALEDALAKANGDGGLGGARLALHVADDGCTTAGAKAAARALVSEAVAVVIGHPCASAATTAAEIYGETGLLMIAVGVRHPDVTDKAASAPILRLGGRDDRQGEAAARWLLAHAPERRIGIVHDRTAYARAIAEGTETALRKNGVDTITVVAIRASRHDYDEAIAELTAAGSETLLFAGYPDEATILVTGLERAGVAAPILGTDSLATDDAFADKAQRAKMPIALLMPTDVVTAGPDVDDKGKGRAARGAFEAWLSAARKSGSSDSKKVAETLKGAAVSTPTLGEIRFDANGDLMIPSFTAASLRGGQWQKEEN